MLFNRGIQKLKDQNQYEAIDLLGRSLQKLVKAEKQHRLVRCLAALGSAYSAVDLYWAAFGCNLAALACMQAEAEEAHSIDPFMLMVLERMYWNEVSIGRIPHALWLLDSVIDGHFANGSLESFQPCYENMDGVLAMLALTADSEQVPQLANTIDHLEGRGLVATNLAVRYCAFGPEDLVINNYVPSGENEERIHAMMRNMWNQPARNDLPNTIETYEGESIKLTSVLLGIRWCLVCENSTVCIRYAESFLAFYESLLASARP